MFGEQSHSTRKLGHDTTLVHNHFIMHRGHDDGDCCSPDCDVKNSAHFGWVQQRKGAVTYMYVFGWHEPMVSHAILIAVCPSLAVVVVDSAESKQSIIMVNYGGGVCSVYGLCIRTMSRVTWNVCIKYVYVRVCIVVYVVYIQHVSFVR